MLERLIHETDALGRLTGDALLLVNKDGTILHATAGGAALFGCPANELTGLPFGIPVAPADAAEITIPATGRIAVLRRENLDATGLPLIRILLHDVTEHRAALADLAASRRAATAGEQAKSHFLANITHEIRTPMIGILGMTELTLGTELSAKQREYLEMARHSAKSLLTVLNDIVDYARIEAGGFELARTPFDLRATVEESVSVFRPLATKKGLDLQCWFATDVPRILVGDASRLRQILINLLGNAVKFTDTGSVVLKVAGVEGEQTPGRIGLRFTVRDTGIGIPRDKVQAIFDSFTQADVSSTRRYQGVGLGLAIVRHLVGLMEGRYDVTSEEGRGSVFTFEVAFGLPDAHQAAPPAEPVAEPGAARCLSVLLAEDNPINQIYVQELLEMDGHSVVVAHTGRRALEALRKKRFDVILMDIQMPEMDGIEATRAIRADQSGDFDPQIPIVALTAHALKGDRETFLRAGMNEYLSKPVSPADLETTLIRAMDGQGGSDCGQAAPEEASPLDDALSWSELLLKARGNTGFLMKLFGAFVAEQPTNLEAMREALALSNLDQLAFMAHSLKGASATMCAPILRETCHDLERAAKDFDIEQAHAAFTVMETAMADVLRAMRGKLEATGA